MTFYTFVLRGREGSLSPGKAGTARKGCALERAPAGRAQSRPGGARTGSLRIPHFHRSRGAESPPFTAVGWRGPPGQAGAGRASQQESRACAPLWPRAFEAPTRSPPVPARRRLLRSPRGKRGGPARPPAAGRRSRGDPRLAPAGPAAGSRVRSPARSRLPGRRWTGSRPWRAARRWAPRTSCWRRAEEERWAELQLRAEERRAEQHPAACCPLRLKQPAVTWLGGGAGAGPGSERGRRAGRGPARGGAGGGAGAGAAGGAGRGRRTVAVLSPGRAAGGRPPGAPSCPHPVGASGRVL